MPKAPKLILPIKKEKAQYLPPHIVVSSVMVNPEMDQAELHRICESLVDTLFYCIVNHAAPGLYLPANSSLFRHSNYKKEENKTSSNSSSDDATSTSADDEDEKAHGENDSNDNKQEEKTQVVMKQSGGKEAIIKAMIDSLDQDFFPFLIQAWEV